MDAHCSVVSHSLPALVGCPHDPQCWLGGVLACLPAPASPLADSALLWWPSYSSSPSPNWQTYDTIAG